MNAAIALVKASHIQPFIKVLKAIDTPVESILAECQLSIDQFDDGDNLIAEKSIWHFMALAAEHTQKTDFGFWVTEQVPLVSYGTFMQQVMCSTSLFSALNRFIELMGMQSNCPTFWLEESQDSIWFCRHGAPKFPHGQWPVEQHLIGLMVELGRAYLGQHWTPARVKLQSAVTDGCQHTNYLKDAELQLAQDYSAVAFPKTLLNEKIKHTQQFFNNLKLRVIPQSNVEKIAQLFQQHYFGNVPTMDEVSRHLAIHPRTLQRLLQKEGSSFREQLEQYKFKRAKQMLKGSTHSIAQVSTELGFTNPANFTRAFKRWSGESPKNYKVKFSTAIRCFE